MWLCLAIVGLLLLYGIASQLTAIGDRQKRVEKRIRGEKEELCWDCRDRIKARVRGEVNALITEMEADDNNPKPYSEAARRGRIRRMEEEMYIKEMVRVRLDRPAGPYGCPACGEYKHLD